jgi:predicted Zn-dependent protease
MANPASLDVPGSETGRAKAARAVLWTLAAAVALVSGCASSTMPGAVGVGRPQLLTVPAEQVDGAAAAGYFKLSGAAGSAGKLNTDPALTARVKAVAQRLVAEVGAFRPDAAKWHWEMNVFDSDQLNAFCVPGGKIGVYSGLVRRLELSDDELAAVLGHEIAHALREHTREQVSQADLSSTIVDVIASSGLRYSGVASVLTDFGSAYLVRLPFSRQMESEADLIGLELMARAGYDPRLASNLWRKLQAQEGTPASAEFFASHPSNEFRIDQVEAATPRVMSVYRPRSAGAGPADADAVEILTIRSAASARESMQPALRLKGGQDEYQARKAAQAAACPNAVPVLVAKAAGSESYRVSCDNGTEMRLVCEFGNCSAR